MYLPFWIAILRDRLLLKPLAFAASLIGTNELRVVLAPTLSTSEELRAFAYINIFFVFHSTNTINRSQEHWNTISECCVCFVSIKIKEELFSNSLTFFLNFKIIFLKLAEKFFRLFRGNFRLKFQKSYSEFRILTAQDINTS